MAGLGAITRKTFFDVLEGGALQGFFYSRPSGTIDNFVIERKRLLVDIIDHLLRTKTSSIDYSFGVPNHSFGLKADLNAVWFNDIYAIAEKLRLDTTPNMKWWMDLTGQNLGNLYIDKIIKSIYLYADEFYSEGNGQGFTMTKRFMWPYSTRNGYSGEPIVVLDLTTPRNRHAVPAAYSYHNSVLSVIRDKLKNEGKPDSGIPASTIKAYEAEKRRLSELPPFRKTTS